jgi:hypothetical protein
LRCAGGLFSAALRSEPDASLKAGGRPLEANETGPRDFGHSRARVPEWLHIGAYPHAFPDRGRLRCRYETPATEHIRCQPRSKAGLIAMQKVEGSNPFSRFPQKPRFGGVFVCL